MIGLRAARRVVLGAVDRLPGQSLPLEEVCGCVTVEALTAPLDVPNFDNSAMDGYAVRAVDTARSPARLKVIGEVRAGQLPESSVGSGECLRIMTGAPLPSRADAVVPVEQTVTEGDIAVVHGPVESGAFVRVAGSDIAAGEELFPGGTVLTPRCIAVLAGSGFGRVRVVPRPRVGVLSSGDEITGPETCPSPGRIRDANGPALRALVRQAGFDVVDLGVVGDDMAEIAGALQAASGQCDALVTSGGVSVGDADFVKVVLDELSGDTMRWMQVAIKPAKPFAFGMLRQGQVPVFALAGNPVSAQVGFALFALPALRLMAALEPLDGPVVSARASAPIRRQPDGKVHLVRVAVSRDPGGGLSADPGEGQASHMAL
jgi:molybdopterin molybdotransferase